MRNRKLFYQIASVIENHPYMHDQEHWFDDSEDDKPFTPKSVIVDAKEYECASSQCVAGWATVLSPNFDEFRRNDVTNEIGIVFKGEFMVDIDATARDELGLTDNEATYIFYSLGNDDITNWPSFLRAIGDGADVREAAEEFWNRNPL